MKNHVILSNTLILTHEKCNNLSKEKNICREGSAGSLPNLYLSEFEKAVFDNHFLNNIPFSVGCVRKSSECSCTGTQEALPWASELDSLVSPSFSESDWSSTHQAGDTLQSL